MFNYGESEDRKVLLAGRPWYPPRYNENGGRAVGRASDELKHYLRIGPENFEPY